ncbi:MAG: PAS domain S-box protein [Nitrospinota bacterium]
MKQGRKRGVRAESDEIAKGIFDAARFLAVLLDLKGNVTYLNPFGENLLGWSAREVAGKNWVKEFVPPQQRSRLRRTFKAMGKEAAAPIPVEADVLCKDGRWRRLAWTDCPLRDGAGKVVGVAGIGLQLPREDSHREELRQGERFLAALREEQNRAQRYLGIAEIIFLELNDRGEATLINQAGCRTLGYEEQEIIGRNWFDVFLPDEIRGEVKSVFQELMRSGVKAAEYYENPVMTKSGQRRLISWHNAVLTDERGKRVGTLSSGVDLTDRRRSEEVIREKETLIRAAMDNMVDGFITIDEDGTIESFNRAAERMFGYSAEEVIGRNVSVLMPEPYRKEHDGYLSDYVRTGEGSIIGVGREVTGRRKDGTAFPVNLAVAEMRLGERRMFVGNLRDLTRERALQSAVQSEQRLKAAIVETSGDAIMALGRDGKILSWNPGAEAVLGYEAQEVLGRHYRFLIPADLQEEGEEKRVERMFAEEGGIRNYATRRRRRDGREIQVMLSRTALREERGELLGYSSILRDVTEENWMREQLHQSEKFSAIGELAAGVAHEIGGPLSVISGNSEFLRESLDPEDPRREDVEGIARECDAVASLIRQLLDFSRPAKVEAKPVDVNECLRNVLLLVRKQIAKSDIELKLDLQVGLPAVLGEVNQLEQVVMNLVLNAWHAMPHGGKLEIRSYAVTEGAGNVRRKVGIQVSDTGVGIAEENLGRIFDPFFSTRPQGEGTGLGLAISRRIVTDHRGTISVHSRLGHGTTFTVELHAMEEDGRK